MIPIAGDENSMMKKNKELLKKIYDQEYAKAKTKAQKASLNRQIQNVKSKARSDAEKRFNRQKHLGKKAKKLGKGFQKIGKDIAKRSKGFKETSDNMLDDIMGW